jgi:hypothetical protein
MARPAPNLLMQQDLASGIDISGFYTIIADTYFNFGGGR